MLCYATLHHAYASCALPCHQMLQSRSCQVKTDHHAMLCCGSDLLCTSTSCHAMFCHAAPCLCHAVLCHAISAARHVTPKLYHAVLCCAVHPSSKQDTVHYSQYQLQLCCHAWYFVQISRQTSKRNGFVDANASFSVEPKTFTHLKNLIPGVASGQSEEGQH